MAAINNVVTRGYSIGTISLVTLRGYTAAEVEPSTAATNPLELGISLTIRIGMPVLAALVSVSILIEILEKVA